MLAILILLALLGGVAEATDLSSCSSDVTVTAGATAVVVSAENSSREETIVCNTGNNLVRCSMNTLATATKGVPLPSQYDCATFGGGSSRDFSVSCFSTSGSTVSVCDKFNR